MNHSQKLNITKVARAIEKDAGRSLLGLRTSLKQAKSGDFTVLRRRGSTAGGTQAITKKAIRLSGAIEAV